MTKVEVVVIRERVETVIDSVEEETGHVGVTVIEAVGHGKQRGVTHEYRGRVFESRFLPKALLIFIVADDKVAGVVAAAQAAAVSGNESGRRPRVDDTRRERHAQPHGHGALGGDDRCLIPPPPRASPVRAQRRCRSSARPGKGRRRPSVCAAAGRSRCA